MKYTTEPRFRKHVKLGDVKDISVMSMRVLIFCRDISYFLPATGSLFLYLQKRVLLLSENENCRFPT